MNSFQIFNFIGFTLPISTDLCQLKRIPQTSGCPAIISPANFANFANYAYLWIFSSEKNAPEKHFVKFPSFAMDTKRTFSDAFQANIFLPLPAPIPVMMRPSNRASLVKTLQRRLSKPDY